MTQIAVPPVIFLPLKLAALFLAVACFAQAEDSSLVSRLRDEKWVAWIVRAKQLDDLNRYPGSSLRTDVLTLFSAKPETNPNEFKGRRETARRTDLANVLLEQAPKTAFPEVTYEYESEFGTYDFKNEVFRLKTTFNTLFATAPVPQSLRFDTASYSDAEVVHSRKADKEMTKGIRLILPLAVQSRKASSPKGFPLSPEAAERFREKYLEKNAPTIVRVRLSGTLRQVSENQTFVLGFAINRAAVFDRTDGEKICEIGPDDLERIDAILVLPVNPFRINPGFLD